MKPLNIVILYFFGFTNLLSQGISTARTNLHLFDLDNIITYYLDEQHEVVQAKLRNQGLQQVMFEPNNELNGAFYSGIYTFEQRYNQTYTLNDDPANGNKRFTFKETISIDKASFKTTRHKAYVRYELNFRLDNESYESFNNYRHHFLNKFMTNHEYDEYESDTSNWYKKMVYHNPPIFSPKTFDGLKNMRLEPLTLKMYYIPFQLRSTVRIAQIDVDITWIRAIPLLNETDRQLSIPIKRLVNNLNTVSVFIGNQEFEFIIDSGASFMVINNEMEKALVSSGHIRPKDYLDKTIVVTASGEEISVDKIKIGVLRLGGAIELYDITAVIIPNGQPLLGKSLLDTFAEWKIDNDANQLHLKRK